MKSSGQRHFRHPRKGRGKRTKNPARFLTDKQLAEVAADLAINRMFGLLGTALAASNPKLREAMLKCSVIVEPTEPPLAD